MLSSLTAIYIGTFAFCLTSALLGTDDKLRLFSDIVLTNTMMLSSTAILIKHLKLKEFL